MAGLALVGLVGTGNVPFVHEAASGGQPVRARVGKFDGPAAFGWLRAQVAYGSRPAGSPASRRLGERLRRALPHGRFQAVPGGLRNVIGTVAGRDPRRFVVVGAHYDTKAIPGFVGANDGASGTAAVVELARGLRPHSIAPTVVFALFDGEEAPAGVPDSDFLSHGDRGSKVAALAFRRAKAMILLDFVANRRLSIPREGSSDTRLWGRLRASARAAGVGRYFPGGTAGVIDDDHTPFQRLGVPAIDLIDFDFPCFHRLCDNLSAVSEASLDVSGEAVYRLLRTL
ncbi:MAG: M28 family peptidase [Thermoleophilaceae bacterium]